MNSQLLLNKVTIFSQYITCPVIYIIHMLIQCISCYEIAGMFHIENYLDSQSSPERLLVWKLVEEDVACSKAKLQFRPGYLIVKFPVHGRLWLCWPACLQLNLSALDLIL